MRSASPGLTKTVGSVFIIVNRGWNILKNNARRKRHDWVSAPEKFVGAVVDPAVGLSRVGLTT